MRQSKMRKSLTPRRNPKLNLPVISSNTLNLTQGRRKLTVPSRTR